MTIIISQNMVVTTAQPGTSGKPWSAWRNYVSRAYVVAVSEDALQFASIKSFERNVKLARPLYPRPTHAQYHLCWRSV
ncbi:hypothetical protein J2782_004005 [Brucella pseudogrignonensis]|uniref:Uncharacterized protein n=1 Tax=Brucella pseudogrignonensis TaxID=419475 RepID=A0ABU1MDY6_9HYPH|nr:hypothetical protein [Brucella pseudogrignonensis]